MTTVANAAATRVALASLMSASKPAAPSAPAKVDWSELDPSTLSPDLQALYRDLQRARALEKSAKTAFEGAMNDKVELEPHLRLIFGYNFGKLSVAIAPKDRPTATPRRAALSLADLIAKVG